MRHAKSDWSNSAQSDFERPLNERGRKAAPLMGQLLLKKNLVPDLIITSSANRALETAEAVVEACKLPADKMTVTDEFYNGYIAEVSQVIRLVDKSVDRLMVVGHNPTWMNLTAHFSDTYAEMSTAEICVLEFPADDWSEISKNSCKFTAKLSLKGTDH